ncbi:MAG: OadG family protein [Ruminiclostridium sp.]|nr:OadG family protein [Ruminiclostridium sp.]
MSDISLGLQLMGYGLVGVFVVLILFYFMILLMMKVFPYRPENEEQNN